MESNREVFLRMSEEHYMAIPEDIRSRYLGSKRVDEEKSDWSENMNDNQFSIMFRNLKALKKQLAEREYQLREKRRKHGN